ncbi:MAG: cytochrome d ubiquinol oxidase subunit II [Phycisphaerae bacterium]|nr:cytochrome d ubiquinol oxidase subunit II [Phycisphaerae bacterium]
MDLNTIWFVLVCVLLTGYAVLDGFDLGTGPLLLLVKDDSERRVFLNAIGPIWNGNEVWLVTAGGALFAAFPYVYATVFSGFYDTFMLLLFALIFRATAIEFRSQRPSRLWRSAWDLAFAVSSLTSALLVGIAIGNLAWGIPLDANHEFQGTLLTLLNPYALCVGVTTVLLFVMHANLYLILKTEGSLHARLLHWTKFTVPAYLVAFFSMNAATLLLSPHIATAIRNRAPVLVAIFVASIAVTLNILREIKHGHEGRAFVSSALSIITLMMLFGAAIFPNLVVSTPTLANSLNIYNGSATDKSLGFMFVVALIGMPIVLAYTVTIYYVFRGKVQLTDESY